jgi:hypothetical protein
MNEKEKLFLEVLTIEIEAIKIVLNQYLGVDLSELDKARGLARKKVQRAKELRKEVKQNGTQS